MDKVMVEFIQSLRQQGMRVSTAETLDAMRAIPLVGYNDRAMLKLALSCCLVKTLPDQVLFDQCFDQFFQVPDSRPARTDKAEPKTLWKAFGRKPTQTLLPQSELGQLLLNSTGAELELKLAQAAKASQLSQMKSISQRGLFGHKMMISLGMGGLDQEIRLNQNGSSQQESLARALTQAKADLQQDIKSYVDRQFLTSTKGIHRQLREAVLMETRIDQLPAQDEAMNLVRKLAKKLAAAHSRRRKVPQYGQLDIQKTLRNNMAYDGVILQTHWRQKKIERPRLWVICDVSGSVRPYAGFLLMFLYCLNDVLSQVRAFAFSSDLVEVTEWFERLPLPQAMQQTLQQAGQGSTDYGQTLTSFHQQHLNTLDHRTTVIILGDGRNNFSDPKCNLLQDIHGRAGQVLWLNPEDKRRWGSGDSEMLRYQAYCSQTVACHNLQQLERFISGLLRYNH